MVLPARIHVLRIFIGEDDKFERRPLYETIVSRGA